MQITLKPVLKLETYIPSSKGLGVYSPEKRTHDMQPFIQPCWQFCAENLNRALCSMNSWMFSSETSFWPADRVFWYGGFCMPHFAASNSIHVLQRESNWGSLWVGDYPKSGFAVLNVRLLYRLTSKWLAINDFGPRISSPQCCIQ